MKIDARNRDLNIVATPLLRNFQTDRENMEPEVTKDDSSSLKSSNLCKVVQAQTSKVTKLDLENLTGNISSRAETKTNPMKSNQS